MNIKKSFYFLPLLSLFFLFTSCEDDSSTNNPLSNYVGVEEAKFVGVLAGETKVVESKIYTTEISSEDRVFQLSVDTNLTTHSSDNYIVPSTVTIPAGSKEGTFQVSIIGNDINSNGNRIGLILSDFDGLNQNIVFQNSVGSKKRIVYNISEVCQTGTTRVKLSMTFDSYPEETAWELYDSNNLLLSSGGFDTAGTSITGFPGEETYTNYFCLAPGNYTFVVYDAYGDGMYTSATVQGTYSLKSLDDTVTYLSGGGNFGTSSVHEFTIQ